MKTKTCSHILRAVVAVDPFALLTNRHTCAINDNNNKPQQMILRAVSQV